MAKLEPTAYPLPDFPNPSEGWETWLKVHEDEVQKLQEASDNLPEGKIVGGLCSFLVADGYALYLVTKESPLTLQHVPAFDAYAIPAAHLRGIRAADVRLMLQRQKAINEIFGRK